MKGLRSIMKKIIDLLAGAGSNKDEKLLDYVRRHYLKCQKVTNICFITGVEDINEIHTQITAEELRMLAFDKNDKDTIYFLRSFFFSDDWEGYTKVIEEMCENDINKVSGKTAFDAMRKGDDAGKMVVDKYIEYIAVGVSNNIIIFQPEVLCIGGGISKEGDTLTKPIKAYVDGENYARNIEQQTEIKVATLGNDAGIIGAAYLCDLYK